MDFICVSVIIITLTNDKMVTGIDRLSVHFNSRGSDSQNIHNLSKCVMTTLKIPRHELIKISSRLRLSKVAILRKQSMNKCDFLCLPLILITEFIVQTVSQVVVLNKKCGNNSYLLCSAEQQLNSRMAMH